MWASAVILGLLGSFHCVGMCGPIAFLLPVDRSSLVKKNTQIGIYHAGRLFSYAIIGVLFGVLGRSFYLFGMQQQLSIAVGVLMVAMAVIPSAWLNRYNLTRPLFKIISKVKGNLGGALKKKTPDTFLTIGFLNGFLPCGLVYLAVFGAMATAHPLEGGLYMILFGLGTIPLMTLAVYLGNFLNGKVRQHIRKAVPVFVVIIGMLFVLRGMGLGIPYLSPKPAINTAGATLECHTSSETKLINNNNHDIQ